MNFENKLLSGVLIIRYKRFFADIKIKNKIITAHCPNTGSMQGLLKKGNKVWLTKSNNPRLPEPYLDNFEIREIKKCIKSNFVSTAGPQVKKFEKKTLKKTMQYILEFMMTNIKMLELK